MFKLRATGSGCSPLGPQTPGWVASEIHSPKSLFNIKVINTTIIIFIIGLFGLDNMSHALRGI